MNKIVIIGASSGIGRALAEAFVSRGVRIGVAARRQNELDNLAEQYPGMVVSETLDVTDQMAPQALHRLIDKLGGMDLYIHVSGICRSNPDMNPNVECEVAETDAVGFARMVSAAFRYFRQTNRAGHIVALSSVAATRGIGELAAYSASKHFVSAYLEAIEQLARMHKMSLTVTDIRPGWVRTPLLYEDRHYPMEMELKRVVPSILEAIVRKKKVAVIDWRWRLVCGVWRLLPRSLWTRMSGFGL